MTKFLTQLCWLAAGLVLPLQAAPPLIETVEQQMKSFAEAKETVAQQP